LADNLAIIVANYDSLDAVFNAEDSVCAVNLKTMWCKYACDPLDAYFKTWIGFQESGGENLAMANFNINSDYGCEIF